jgi:hypothetical protein
MIYMLVAAEDEVPWPSEFIQEDWCWQTISSNLSFSWQRA